MSSNKTITIRKLKCPKVTIDVNSTNLGTVASGDTLSVSTVDTDGNPIATNNTLAGNDLEIAAPAATATINTNEVTASIPSGGSKNFNLLDADGNAITVDSVSGDDVNLDITPDQGWWTRNPDWLDMPTVTAGDNVFYGLFAVYENGFNAVAINKNGTASLIDWGDGTTVTSTGTENHVYDYATITSPVLVDGNGFNYKMVIVQIDLPSNITQLFISEITSPTTGVNERTQNWLDIRLDTTGISGLVFQPSVTARYKCRLLERLVITGDIGQFNAVNQGMSNLRIFDYDSSTYPMGSLIDAFTALGNVRDLNGNPININSDQTAGGRAFDTSAISEIGNLTFSNVNSGNLNQMFRNSRIRKVGNIYAPMATDLLQMFIGNKVLTEIGTITVGSSLTRLSTTFNRCESVRKIEFLGDMSGVTNTFAAFTDCFSLKRLLLTGITVGFDIKETQITGQNLQDLFDSLGTASGAQTITLPAFTSGEPTGIATGKGYTIAYA